MAAPESARLQDRPPREARPGKKWVKVPKVVDGVETEEWIEVDAEEEALAWPPRESMRLLGTDIRRVDGPDKVTGRARYAHDVRLPGMLFARLLLCPHPSARIVSIDVEPARALSGVAHARVLREGTTRYLGQPVAAVAASTPERAQDALRAIRVEYEPLPFAVTYEQAIADGAPQVTDQGNVRPSRSSGDREEAEKALEGSDAVVEATYRLPVQHHACLETHGLVVDPGGGQATVYASTQATFAVHGDVPEPLGLEPGQVTVLVPHMGGGFGAKFGIGVEGRVACEIARELGRPVHLMLTRSDEFLMGGNRSGCVQTLKAGATKDGELVSIVADVHRLGGIGGGSHPGQPYVYRARAHFSGSDSVHTNTDGSRAFRAPGHPQASFAMESIMDELAYAIGMDPLSFRMRNLPDEVWVRQLERCAREIGWEDHPHKTDFDRGPGPVKIGIGFGVSTWGGGGRPQCQVEVAIARDGGVTVKSGTQDLGTGTRTYVAAIVAEHLGLELEDVVARIGSSDYGAANGSGGSTTAASLSPAVLHAASNARRALLEKVAAERGVDPAILSTEGGAVVDAGSGERIPWRDACALLGPAGITAQGVWQRQLADNGVHGAQAAKVEVDVRTGEVRVVQMVCVQDCGLALNPMATRSQIQGGMIQALSYGLLEERVIDPDLGILLNANFDDYKIAGCQEIPDMLAIIDEADRRAVIGIGEPPAIPGHGAIANAIHNACGARLREMPLTPDKVLAALAALPAGGRGGEPR